MRAARYLGRILELDARIDRKQAEKERVMELATHITPTMSDMPHGGGGTSDKVGNAGARLADLEHEIVATIDELIDAKREVLAILELLPVDDYQVLHMHFVQGLTYEEIADNFQPKPKSVRQIHRIKSRAIKRVQTILDEREEASEV